MTLKDELYVCTLAECGTIKAAAEKLYISPPALSMYIRNLEKELGTDLFYRQQQGFVPTEIGRDYLQRSQKILALDNAFQQKLAAYKIKKKNKITLGMYRRRGISFMVPLQKVLKGKMPETTFQIIINSGMELKRLLIENALDYILVTSPNTKNAIPICKDTLVLACPACWNLAAGIEKQEPVSLRQIPTEKILLPGLNQSIYVFVKKYLEENHLDLTKLTTLNNMEIAMQNVSAGIGCCFTLKSYIRSFSHIPGITFYSLKGKSTKIFWYLEFTHEVLSPHQQSQLCQCIRETIEG